MFSMFLEAAQDKGHSPQNRVRGDAGGKTLFITARTGLYRVRSKD